MKSLLCLLFLVFSITTTAQVAINNDNSTPDPSAMLDVKSTDKGMLIPRMTQAQRIAVVAPATGLLVYQTDNPAGFYYYNGAGWFRLSLQNEGWSTTGNAGTNPANNFFGTTDNQPLSFRLNNTPAGKFDNVKRNYFVGAGSGLSNITGEGNIAIGNGTLKKNTIGSGMVAIGDSALYNYHYVLGDAVAIGYRALFSDTTGHGNIAIGNEALSSNLSGDYNIALGINALTSNLTGDWNIAIGGLTASTNASYNTGIGINTLGNNYTGENNTALGFQALFSNDNGNGNTGIGFNAGRFLPSNVNNVTAIGNYSGFTTTPSNHINIGNTSNVWIGGQVNWSVWSDKRIKKDIQQNVPGLSFIMKLKPVTYHLDIHKQNEMVYTRGSDTLSWPGKYDIETITQTGFIAQEVELAAKQSNYDFSGVIAPKNEEGLYSIRYAEFVVPLVKAIQEQQTIIDDQNKKIDNLLKQNAQMNARIEKLENK
jgi:trimeric autotransporter adhesin